MTTVAGGKKLLGMLGRRRMLTERQESLLEQERRILNTLRSALQQFGVDVAPGDMRTLDDTIAHLDELFLLVIAGEFNSGKSSFINALLGERVVPEGVTPTTDRINLLRYGAAPGEHLAEAFLTERTYPAELLRELNIVDTPGTNAIVRRHEELTRDYVPRADLVLFVTSADRPFTESERAFLEQVRQWGKKILFVINKIDILDRPAERDEVAAYVGAHAAELLGEEPRVFSVSARQALEARTGGAAELWERSGFEAVEEYLLRTLDQDERIRLKLLNPLNVGLRLAARYKDAAFERLTLLAGDVETLRSIDEQLGLFHRDMLRDFEPRLARLDLLLNEMERRGSRFFEETVRIGRIRSLLDSEAVRRAFEHEVIADTPQQVETEVGRIIDWIVERNLQVWQDVTQFIDRSRIARHREQMVGEVGSGFTFNRQALLESVGRVAREVVGTYDREAEARTIANDVQGTFATTALAEASALGIGTLVATVITGVAADVTGILLATALAVGGFYLIPRKRRQAQRDFQTRVEALRARLREGLRGQVHLEITQSTDRVNQAVAPYRRFVESQLQRLNDIRGELVATEDALLRLRAELEGRSPV